MCFIAHPFRYFSKTLIKCILKEWSIYPLDGGQQVVLSIITIIMTNRVQNREKDGKYYSSNEEKVDKYNDSSNVYF